MNSDILTHLKELRYRVILCFINIFILMILAYIFFNFFYSLFSKPFSDIDSSNSFYVTSVIEGVLIKLKFSLIFGIILSIPCFIFHILRFFIPGLTSKEAKILIYSIISCTVLAIGSFFYSYFVVLPTSIDFLMSHHFIPNDVGILLNYSQNLLYVFNIIAYLIIIFQLPVLLMLLLHFNVLSRKQLLSYSRYFIIIIFILSAIFTPPDVISQLLLSIPLIFLFFSVLLLSKILKIGNNV
tara:strand:- start:1245 stop:1964 length:720 start_codon:yes stop_codon:yes gene_type:complete